MHILAIPTVLWLAASLLLVEHWRRGACASLSILDSPGRALADPSASTLSDALGLLWIVPMIGFPFAVIGAELGSNRRRPAVKPSPTARSSRTPVEVPSTTAASLIDGRNPSVRSATTPLTPEEPRIATNRDQEDGGMKRLSGSTRRRCSGWPMADVMHN